MKLFLVLALLATLAQAQQYQYSNVNITALVDSFSMGYDQRIRPNYGGPGVSVGVSMYVLSISELSETNMDFKMDMYFRQFWNDPRLSYEEGPGLNKIVLGRTVDVEKFWMPDTFFVNEKSAMYHKATTDNQFLRILPNGDVLRSIRLTVQASCPMDLQYYPMDSQLCYLEIESFGYTMKDIRYKWNEGLNSVQISSDVSLPQFKVLGHRQKTIEASLSTGNYSRLAVEIQFERAFGYYFATIYIPAAMVVIISWFSFWLNRNATTARIVLGITTVLTMTIIGAATNAALPKVSYTKAIDVYTGWCCMFVFFAMAEYIVVAYMTKRIDMKEGEEEMFGVKPSKIDVVSRVAFPALFGLFVMVYCITYSSLTGDVVEDLVYLHQ